MNKTAISEKSLENRAEALIRARKMGLSVTWFVTWLCNYQCPFCWERIDDSVYRKSLMKTNQILPERWADAFNQMHPKEIYFTGGEPTLYKRLPEVFGLLDPKIKFKITSNFGPSFDLDKYGSYILEKRFSVVGLSFHPSEVDSKSFLLKMDNALEMGYNEACDLGIEMVLYPDDLVYAPELIKYCSQNHVKLIFDTYHDSKGVYVMQEDLKRKADEYKRQAEEINRDVKKHKNAYGSNMGITADSLVLEDKVILYGIGKAGRELEKELNAKGYKKIKCFIDKFQGGKGLQIDGIEVLSPKDGTCKYPDATYVITVQKKELVAEIAILLFSLGIPEDRIKVYEKGDSICVYESARGKNPVWCPAGMATLHVDPNGEMYPCMRAMTNEKEKEESTTAIRMKLGNILDNNWALLEGPIVCTDSHRCSACDYQLLDKVITSYE